MNFLYMEKKLLNQKDVRWRFRVIFLFAFSFFFTGILEDAYSEDQSPTASEMSLPSGITQLGGTSADPINLQPNQPINVGQGVVPSTVESRFVQSEEDVMKVREPEPSKAEIFFNSESKTGSAGHMRADEVDLDLKQLGYNFFTQGVGFKPDPSSQVGPDYILGPGDTLRLDVWGSIEGNYIVAIDRNGEIALPKIGVINLWGQTFEQATQTIRKQIEKYFNKFELNVSMGALRSIQVYIVGEVKAPGAYQVSSLSTALSALSEAGGPIKSGSLRKIEVIRNGNTVTTIDLYDFLLKGDRSKDTRLQSGDTILVPVTGSLVAIAGNVRRPAIYELKGNETLEKALQLAGGLIPTAYLQKIQLDRIQSNRLVAILDLDISSGQDNSKELNMVLQDHDRIRIAPISLTGGYVRLSGYVVRPGDYQLTPDIRLADLLLPYENLLPEFYPDMAQIIRTAPPEYRPEMMTVNLQKALDGDSQHNILLKEYDTVKIFSRKQMQEEPQVVVSGAVLNPGTYRLYEKMTVKDLVALAGSLKKNAFMSEAEITRFHSVGRSTETERIIIDLEKALKGVPDQNITLRDDDHLFVRLIPDSGEKSIVQILGEVLFPGTYAIAKGEKIASIIQRAGGYTKNAYLPGAFFTRESLKETQLIHTDRLIAEQEQAIYRLSSIIATGALSEEDVEASQAMLKSRQELLDKLKQAPVTGRMVIRLSELEKMDDSQENIELLSGDVLNIPSNPKTVTVLGQVYNPISMAYISNQTVGFYLDKVGGPKETADESQIYVVRANGSVYSKQQAGMSLRWDRANKRWYSGSFYSEELFPGDVILVPEKIKYIDWMKEIRDITTILYQITLGAAVILAL